ncbi:MAG: diacylglycerol kinase family lipid kinase [Clostridia bacterium]|nr:diacylglycerol kinase family lipid kinase [Clostridia bacterium]
MEHLFVINPVAGKNDRTAELKDKIKGLDIKDKVIVKVTEKPGEATEIVRNHLENTSDYTRVYACGGDGTANEVLRGIAGFKNAAMGVIPIGSGNDFVRSFNGFLREDFMDISRMVKGEEMTVDVMECQGRYSMNVLSVGYDCAVAKNVDKFKKIPFVSGGLAYKMSIIYCLFTKREHHFKVLVDGKKFADEKVSTLLSVAGKGSYYGGGIKAAPKARLNDGKIEFMHITTIPALKFIFLLGQYIRGNHVDNPRFPFVKSMKCESIAFESDKEIDVNFEGEIVPMKNPVIKLIPNAVKVIVPKVREKELAERT